MFNLVNTLVSYPTNTYETRGEKHIQTSIELEKYFFLFFEFCLFLSVLKGLGKILNKVFRKPLPMKG